MTSEKKTIVGCTLGMSVVCLTALVCIVTPSIHRKLFRRNVGERHYVFVDRLAGKPYSKGNYNGIDVSKHQGVIKWQEVAKDRKIEFVYIRATMGKNHVDALYRRNIKDARLAGLKVGSYHFLTSKYSVTEQFDDFLSTVKPSEQDLLPMVDVEDGWIKGWSKEQLRDSLMKFSRLVEKHYGRKPMVYSNESFYNAYLAPCFNDYILYVANYRSKPKINGGGRHSLWQYSERGHIRGIGEYVDLCRFNEGVKMDDIMLRK